MLWTLRPAESGRSAWCCAATSPATQTERRNWQKPHARVEADQAKVVWSAQATARQLLKVEESVVRDAARVGWLAHWIGGLASRFRWAFEVSTQAKQWATQSMAGALAEALRQPFLELALLHKTVTS